MGHFVESSQLHLLKGGHDWVPKQCRLPRRKLWLAHIPTNRFGIWLIVLFPPKVWCLILVDLIISIAGLILFSGPGGVGVYLLSLGLHSFTLTFPGSFWGLDSFFHSRHLCGSAPAGRPDVEIGCSEGVTKLFIFISEVVSQSFKNPVLLS